MAGPVHDDRGHVYFLLARAVGRIKIGFSTNVAKRIAELQLASPCKLIVLKHVRADYHAEQTIHAVFKAHRIHGEWFHAAPSLMRFIDSLNNDEEFFIEQIALAGCKADR